MTAFGVIILTIIFIVILGALIIGFLSLFDAWIDGDLDAQYARQGQGRSNDHHEGIRRSLYEIGYARAESKRRILEQRNKERKDQTR